MLEILNLRYNLILENRLKGELESLELKGEVEAEGILLNIICMLNGISSQLW